MAEEIVMPRLSDTMERGTIARWLVHEGDAVHEGDVLAEIETDKATMELNSYSDGVLLRILVQDGEAAELGAPIALVGAEGEDVSGFSAAEANGDAAAGAGEAPAPSATAVAAPAAPASDTAAPASAGGELKASPVARRIAADAGFDLRPLAGKGSGPDGRIVRVDVERALAGGAPPASAPSAAAAAPEPAPSPAPAPARAAAPPLEADVVIEPSPMLKAVARRMSASKSEVPHFYLQCEIDMGKALALREELNAELAADGVKLTVNDLIVRACALALRDHPQFHRSWVDGKIYQHSAAHVGVAVALDEGLIVPVIRNADSLPLRELAGVARDLVARARSGSLKQTEIEGGTFSVSNLGMLGITSFQAIINPPEPGILAVGSVVERATGVGGQVVVRPLMTVNLSVDHRAASGADGARLLQTVTRYLEHPLLLLV
ncbi:MAG TPA: dihydrolipoamide acetyltransferase family protein [Gaiellales bacterium]|nr:dihydrolipoamide acetyltransferase family protein [Gaiellales bacterium]